MPRAAAWPTLHCHSSRRRSHAGEKGRRIQRFKDMGFKGCSVRAPARTLATGGDLRTASPGRSSSDLDARRVRHQARGRSAFVGREARPLRSRFRKSSRWRWRFVSCVRCGARAFRARAIGPGHTWILESWNPRIPPLGPRGPIPAWAASRGRWSSPAPVDTRRTTGATPAQQVCSSAYSCNRPRRRDRRSIPTSTPPASSACHPRP